MYTDGTVDPQIGNTVYCPTFYCNDTVFCDFSHNPLQMLVVNERSEGAILGIIAGRTLVPS